MEESRREFTIDSNIDIYIYHYVAEYIFCRNGEHAH